MLCGQHRYINGHVDIFVLPSLHGAVQRSERECAHSMQMGWRRCIFRGQLKDCRRCYTSPLFLFFGGLVIFLNKVDQEVFICVVSWIGLFSVVYGLITLLPLIRQDSPYYSPLSTPAWFLYTSIRYVTFKKFATPNRHSDYQARERYRDLMKRYRDWMWGGAEKKAEEMAEEQSSKIDIGILGWTISVLGDDHSLEKLIEAVPGFFNSKLVKDLRGDLPDDISTRLTYSLDGFLVRTLSSNSIIDSVKLRRLDISLIAMNLIHVPGLWSIFGGILFKQWNQLPKDRKSVV